MYVYDDVKTQKLQVRGTPCKRCSRSQVEPRLAAQINTAVSLDRTRMVNMTSSHHFFCSWYSGVYMTKHISHTCGRRSCRPARYLSSSTHSQTLPIGVLQQLFECLEDLKNKQTTWDWKYDEYSPPCGTRTERSKPNVHVTASKKVHEIGQKNERQPHIVKEGVNTVDRTLWSSYSPFRGKSRGF